MKKTTKFIYLLTICAVVLSVNNANSDSYEEAINGLTGKVFTTPVSSYPFQIPVEREYGKIIHLGDGVEFTEFQWDPTNNGARPVNVYVLEMPKTTIFDVTRSEDRMQTTSDFSEAYGCLAAINAGFFYNQADIPGEDKYCHPTGPTWGGRSDAAGHYAGEDWNNSMVYGTNDKYFFATYGGMPFIDTDPTIPVPSSPIPDLLVSGRGVLVLNGEPNNFHESEWAPRTAVAETYENTILFVITDELNGNNTGLTLKDFSYLLGTFIFEGDQINKGVKTAINLDGGGSTAMYIRNLGLLNKPTDNPSTAQPTGERIVSNHLGIGCTKTGRLRPLVLPVSGETCNSAN